MDNRFDDDRHNGTWIMSKFFYPPNYLGFEINLESVLEIISLTTLLASLILLVYNRLFKHKSIKVSNYYYFKLVIAMYVLVFTLNKYSMYSQTQYVMPQPTSMVVSSPQQMNMTQQPIVTVAPNNIPVQIPMQTIVNRPGPLPPSPPTSIQQPVVPMPGTRKRIPNGPASDTQTNLLNPGRTIREPPSHVQRVDPRSPTRQAPPVQQVQPMVVMPQPVAQMYREKRNEFVTLRQFFNSI